MASTGGGGMGMGGGPDSAPGGSSSSSGTGNAPGEGMGADAFDANEGSSQDFGNTIEAFRSALAKALGQVTQEQKDKAVEAQKNQESLTKKTGISVAKTTEQISKEQQLQNLIDKFDPKAKVKHNPHLESLEPGAYDANVSLDLDQQLDLGLITQFEYDATNAMINQEMPIGKNYDIGTKNTPTIDPGVEDVDQETRMGAFRNISYGSFPSAVVDNGLLGAATNTENTDPQENQEAIDAIGRSQRSAQERDINKNVDIGIGPETPKDAFRDEESKRMGQTLEALDRDPSPEVTSASLDDDPFGGTMAEKERDALALSFVNDVEKEYDRIMKETKAFSKERALALRNLNAIKSTDLFSKSYAVANPSAIRDMVAKAMALFSGLGPALTIAKAIESRAIKAGMFDRTTFDQMMSALDDPGAFGPLGNPLGTGGADQNTQEKKIRDILAVVEPWTKGLNKRQIEYYYDNEEELDWVRNLYEQMNKSASA